MYRFTNDWFESQRPIHEKIMEDNPLPHDARILEIGSHEGRSSVFFLDCLSPKGTLVCVDPYSEEDTTTPVSDSTMEMFYHNIKLTGKSDLVRIYREYSYSALAGMILQDEIFDYILIDGSHLSRDVLTDAVMCFGLLKKGGIMFFDDYMGGDISSLGFPKTGIDSFVKAFADQIEILHVGYHYVIKKLN